MVVHRSMISGDHAPHQASQVTDDAFDRNHGCTGCRLGCRISANWSGPCISLQHEFGATTPMTSATFVILSGMVTFGLPIIFALYELRRLQPPPCGGSDGPPPPPCQSPILPKPLPDCLLPKPLIIGQATEVRALELV